MPSTKFTVTAGGSTANGISGAFRVVLNAAPPVLQTGATATQSGVGAHETSITTTTTGARCFMAAVDFVNTAWTADANTTIIDQVSDGTNLREYTGGRQTLVVGTPGATTVGFTAPADNGGLAVVEILPVPGTSLAGATDLNLATPNKTNGTSVTSTAAAIPDGGQLVVAMISANGGAGQVTMAVTDSLGLTWTELIRSNAAGAGYAGVWVAYLPGQPAQNALPGQTWRRAFQHRQIPPPPNQRFATILSSPVTASGSQSAQTGKTVTGTVTAAGALSNQVGRLLTGTASAAGALSNQAGKLLAGTSAAAGTITRQAGKVITGTATAAGALARRVGKIVPGTATVAGSQTAQTGKHLAGGATASGTLTRSIARALAGAATASGSVTRGIGRTLTGTATAAGSVLRSIGRILSGAVSAVGTLIIPAPPPHVYQAQVTITPAGPLAAQVAFAEIVPSANTAITPAGPLAATTSVTAAGATVAQVTITAAGNSAATVTIAEPRS